jgi:hypothetical protein
MRPRAASRASDHLPRLQPASLAVRAGQRRTTEKHDHQLLVGVVGVEREGRGTGRHVEERGTELTSSRLLPKLGSAPAKRRLVAFRVPVGFKDVGHERPRLKVPGMSFQPSYAEPRAARRETTAVFGQTSD